MRLKKLIVHGFKSFADRTEFAFDAPITGIVGPNGAGKSNVVDAVKWVLGEQSAKSLRGDAMLDVIFNGADSRKPAAMAEVVLVFDNPRTGSDGPRKLNLDLDEVAVGRRLYRDGTSEYQLNNQSTRLKDVRELFLDTGIGVDAYSVIEQGRVQALLDSNPQERRIVFEEAAGISKYKMRKKEAQRKLERVEQNLLRATDIVEEVERRLRGVRVQAGRARTYQEHNTRLSELRLALALKSYDELDRELKESQKRQEDSRFRLDDAAADLARKQNELASAREKQEQAAASQQKFQYEQLQSEGTLASARQTHAYADEQLAQLSEQVAALGRDEAVARQRVVTAEKSVSDEQAHLEALTEELAAKREQIERRQQDFKQAELSQAELEEQIERHRTSAMDVMRRSATLSNRLSSMDNERAGIGRQQERLVERRGAVSAEAQALTGEEAKIRHELETAIAALEAMQRATNAKREEAQQLDEKIAGVSEALGTAREHRSGLLSRQALLTDLENRREGVSEGVKAVLRQRAEKYPFVRGLVADMLRVDVEHARVIEAALDGRDQLLVTTGSVRLSAQQAALEELAGRVNFLHAEELQSPETAVDFSTAQCNVRLAMDLVTFDAADGNIVGHLLRRTAVVPTLGDAVTLRESGPRGWRYVTLAAEVVEADGTLRAGPLTAAMGILSRRSELSAIQQQIAEVDGRIAELARQLEEGNAAAKAIDEQLNTLRSETYRASTHKVELSSRLAQTTDKLAAASREQAVLERELALLAESVKRLDEESNRVTSERAELEKAHARLQEQGTQAAAKLEEIADSLRQWAEELTALRVEVGQVQEKQLAAEQAVQRNQNAVQEIGEQIRRIEEMTSSMADRRRELEAQAQESTRQEEMLVAQIAQLAEQAKAKAVEVESVQQQAKALTMAVEQLRETHAQAEQAMHAAEMRSNELRVRVEALVQRCTDELQMDLPARYAEASAAAGPDGYQAESRDWAAVGEEIQQLRDKIMKLGNVNIDSIGEQDELEQRRAFLQTQLDDLVGSRQQLQELIDTINVESAQRFEETFNIVREHFQGMFRKLFGGGKADIYLETELDDATPAPAAVDGEAVVDNNSAEAPAIVKQPAKADILDAGIEIIARPPGKQPVRISQLSGGEKTMTCVALLMSIFKSKPSPFCILDEVDAALDEANNQRFNMIVQEFLQDSQFIIITHSKRTMQIADLMYGVTMQEQGVSKRVSVKFDQVDQQGRITETAAA